MYPKLNFINNVISAQSMTTNITSTVLNVVEINSFSVHAVWTGGSTPVGAISLLASIDGNNFTEIGNLPVSGNTGSNLFNVSGIGYPYVQVQYLFTSGSGTLTVKLSGKL